MAQSYRGKNWKTDLGRRNINSHFPLLEFEIIDPYVKLGEM